MGKCTVCDDFFRRGIMNLQINTMVERNRRIVQLEGEVDVYTASILKEALTPLTKQNNVEIIIDLSHVHYIDSTGLGIFIGTLKAANKAQSTLRINGANERISRLFSITGLDEVIEIEADKREEV